MRSVEEKLAFKCALEERTAAFALGVFRLLDALPHLPSTRVISFQLGKSASSIGANYREANRAESPDDFKHKIAITLKECSESLYWLKLLYAFYPNNVICSDLFRECDEMLRIFQTVKRRLSERKAE